MKTTPHETKNTGYGIPPEIYDVGVGWDPQPEIDRLLLLTRQAGVEPRSALELGCATGRLLQPLRKSVPDAWGIELCSTMAQFARKRNAGEIIVGDMADFALGRGFDLIFTSANTIRHVLTDATLGHMWKCIHDHLAPGGVFIADLELGFDAEAKKVGNPATWEIARGEMRVKATWLVTEAPSPKSRRSKIQYTFESRGDKSPGIWHERFELRTYDAPEFLKIATTAGRLKPIGIYELRDPYLVETPPEKAIGRHLVAFHRPEA